MKSDEYRKGFTDALVFASDIFELHSQAFLKKGLMRLKDVRLVVNILNACIRTREILSEVGPTKMNLYVSKNREAVLKEK